MLDSDSDCLFWLLLFCFGLVESWGGPLVGVCVVGLMAMLWLCMVVWGEYGALWFFVFFSRTNSVFAVTCPQKVLFLGNRI